MEPEIKKAWIKALRSGKYLQGRNALRKPTIDKNKDQFCCLGVLCDIIDSSKWEKPKDYCHFEWNECSAFLHSSISKEQNISNLIEEKLIKMNDDGHSFDEIASYIEKEI